MCPEPLIYSFLKVTQKTVFKFGSRKVAKMNAQGPTETQWITGRDPQRNLAVLNSAWLKGLSNGTLKTFKRSSVAVSHRYWQKAPLSSWLQPSQLILREALIGLIVFAAIHGSHHNVRRDSQWFWYVTFGELLFFPLSPYFVNYFWTMWQSWFDHNADKDTQSLD